MTLPCHGSEWQQTDTDVDKGSRWEAVKVKGGSRTLVRGSSQVHACLHGERDQFAEHILDGSRQAASNRRAGDWEMMASDMHGSTGEGWR